MAKMTPGILLVLMVAACGGGDDRLVGTWMEALTPSQDTEVLTAITYNADGTWGTEVSESVGEWIIENDRLFTMHDSMWNPSEDTQFEVDGDRLITDVMRPNGDVDGVLGGWLGIAHGTGPTDRFEEHEYRIGLSADGTGWFSHAIDGEVYSLVGTWRRDRHFLILETPQDTVLDFIVAPGAIGRRHRTRVD